MIIHRGDKYTIEVNGTTAIKSDGTTKREMRYYPERDIAAIAGEIDEQSAWQILHDISRHAATLPQIHITPRHILIDGKGFVLSEWSGGSDDLFTAPEGYEPAWALGASVFYVFLGCHVFQSMGGRGQTSTAPVPTLRRELPELSSLIKRCLAYEPHQRPSLAEIEKTAAENIERCKQNISEFPPLKSDAPDIIPPDEIDRFWPEEM